MIMLTTLISSCGDCKPELKRVHNYHVFQKDCKLINKYFNGKKLRISQWDNFEKFKCEFSVENKNTDDPYEKFDHYVFNEKSIEDIKQVMYLLKERGKLDETANDFLNNY